MNVNMHGFQLLLNFVQEYQSIDNFPFTRIAVDFENDGNYSVYLGEKNFEGDWNVHLEDEFKLHLVLNDDVIEKALDEFKKTHLIFLLKAKSN